VNYYIKDQSWKSIFAFLSGLKWLHTSQELSLRRFIEAIWYICRTGCQWRLLPKEYGVWRSIHKRFKRWSDKGIWLQLFESCQNDPDIESFMIDATIIRAHACSAGYGKESKEIQALGRSRGGFTTKIHAMTDALGYPLQFILTPGQRHEITQAERLTENISNTTVIADKGYDSNAFVESLEEKGCTVVIPPRSNRKTPRDYDKHVYKERHLIECFFGKIKYFRRIFSRFDKTAGVFMSFLNFVGVLIWLR
jgi:transposase